MEVSLRILSMVIVIFFMVYIKYLQNKDFWLYIKELG